MDVATPGAWIPYGSGRRVRCAVPVTRNRLSAEQLGIGTCNKVILAIGRRKLALVRIVGNNEAQVSPDVHGCTFRCDCGTIYEVEWWDRRRQDRSAEPAQRREIAQ